MPVDDDKLRRMHERERDALLSAQRSRTTAIAMGVGVLGLLAGIYIGRDVARDDRQTVET